MSAQREDYATKEDFIAESIALLSIDGEFELEGCVYDSGEIIHDIVGVDEKGDRGHRSQAEAMEKAGYHDLIDTILGDEQARGRMLSRLEGYIGRKL